jgi:hypothetical protein
MVANAEGTSGHRSMASITIQAGDLQATLSAEALAKALD